MASTKKTVDRFGPFWIVEGDVDGKRTYWVERAGKRLSGNGSVDDAREHANLFYEEYLLDADVNTGE